MYCFQSTELLTLELQKKKCFKSEKTANGKLGNVGNLGNIILSFFLSEFSNLPYSRKNFPRFLRFPSFRPGLSRRLV